MLVVGCGDDGVAGALPNPAGAGTAGDDAGVGGSQGAPEGGVDNGGGAESSGGVESSGGGLDSAGGEENGGGVGDAGGATADGGAGAGAGPEYAGSAGMDGGASSASSDGGAAGAPVAIASYAIGGSVKGLTGTLVLQNNGGDALVVSENGDFVFGTSLVDGSAYEVKLESAPSLQACSVAAGSGMLSGADVLDVVVTCVDKTWQGAKLLEHDDANPAGSLSIAFDDEGSATALWWQKLDDTHRVMESHFSGAGAWTGAAPLDVLGSNTFADTDVAFGADGGGMAVWIEYRGAVPSVRASRRIAGSWQQAVFIDQEDSGSARFPQVAVNGDGDAVAVWLKDGDAGVGMRMDLWASRYIAGSGWSTAAPIETDDTGGAEHARVKLDEAGNVIAVWAQREASERKNIWYSRDVGDGWETPAPLETSDTNADDPEIAMQPGGDAVAVWASSHAWARSYSAVTGKWGSIEQLSSSVTATRPQVGVDAGGHSLVVWTQYDGYDIASVWSRRRAAGAAWDAIEPVQLNDTHSAAEPDLAVNAAGDALVTWLQHDGIRNDVWCSRYVVDRGWDDARGLDEQDTHPFSPQAALSAQGDAVVVWQQSDGKRESAWSNVFR